MLSESILAALNLFPSRIPEPKQFGHLQLGNTRFFSQITIKVTTQVYCINVEYGPYSGDQKLPSTISLAVEVFSLFPKRKTQVYSPASES